MLGYHRRRDHCQRSGSKVSASVLYKQKVKTHREDSSGSDSRGADEVIALNSTFSLTGGKSETGARCCCCECSTGAADIPCTSADDAAIVRAAFGHLKISFTGKWCARCCSTCRSCCGRRGGCGGSRGAALGQVFDSSRRTVRAGTN